jgi:HK97 family phage major capsid protein
LRQPTSTPYRTRWGRAGRTTPAGSAAWRRSILRQAKTGSGALKFPSLQNNPPTLLGRPTHEASFMDVTIGAGRNLLIYGDFSNFVVTQRVEATVELIPRLFGANRRPTGQRGLYMWARYGSDSINDSAFRLLQA